MKRQGKHYSVTKIVNELLTDIHSMICKNQPNIIIRLMPLLTIIISIHGEILSFASQLRIAIAIVIPAYVVFR